MAPNSISRNTVVRASTSQTSTNLGDSVAVLQMQSGVYYGLDGAGAEIWQMIQEPTEVGAVCDRLATLYEVDPERCERDVVTFLEELAREGLVTAAER